MFDSGVDTEQAFGQHEAMTRTRVRRRRTTLSVAAAVMLTVVLGPLGHAFQADATLRHPRTVVVRPGDTLWAIAARIEPASDPRAVADGIAAANGIDPAGLVPGQRLVVPAP
jgi:nucleoid-associated protein YgaU